MKMRDVAFACVLRHQNNKWAETLNLNVIATETLVDRSEDGKNE